MQGLRAVRRYSRLGAVGVMVLLGKNCALRSCVSALTQPSSLPLHLVPRFARRLTTSVDSVVLSVDDQTQSQFPGFNLSVGPTGKLQVLPQALKDGKLSPLSIDFGSCMRGRVGPEQISSAFGSGPYDAIIDFTAGLGRDSVILASATSAQHIVMIERNRIMQLLLSDALLRFQKETEFQMVASKLRLLTIDAVDTNSIYSELSKLMIIDPQEEWILEPAVPRSIRSIGAYLDPMYPPNLIGKKSLVKRDTQILQHIVTGADNNVPCTQTIAEDELLDKILALQPANKEPVLGVNDPDTINLFLSAWDTSTSRTVVKRPLNSPHICNIPAHSVVKGSRQRFDLYFKNRSLLK
jgi:hypothetical protein